MADPKSVVVERDRATRLGRWLLDRAALVAGMILITYIVLGVVAWGVTQTNQRSKRQLQQMEDVLQRVDASQQANQRILERMEETGNLIKDCSTPGGECFEQQIQAQSVSAALQEITDAVNRTIGCILLVEPNQRTPEILERCGVPKS